MSSADVAGFAVALQQQQARLATGHVTQAAGTHDGVGQAAGAQRGLAPGLPGQDVATDQVQQPAVEAACATGAGRGYEHELAHARAAGGIDQVAHAAKVDELRPVRPAALSRADGADDIGRPVEGWRQGFRPGDIGRHPGIFRADFAGRRARIARQRTQLVAASTAQLRDDEPAAAARRAGHHHQLAPGATHWRQFAGQLVLRGHRAGGGKGQQPHEDAGEENRGRQPGRHRRPP